ncbi:MAG: hypothetical protein Q6373_017285 [Candidatus Sigynarchaeota archaeon]
MNNYLCIYSDARGIEMPAVLKVVDLFEKHEISYPGSFPEARNHVLQTFQEEMESSGRFFMSFDPTLKFRLFMNRMFQAQYYKAAEEKWKRAEGETLAVGFAVLASPTEDMVKHGIDSYFVALRVIFSDECVEELLPLFKKRFAETYKDFLRDVQDVVKGIMAFGYYSELPTEL